MNETKKKSASKNMFVIGSNRKEDNLCQLGSPHPKQ